MDLKKIYRLCILPGIRNKEYFNVLVSLRLCGSTNVYNIIL